MDISKLSDITDFFIILSGNSTRQVRAITDHIIEKLKQLGHRAWHIEGYRYALWVLLDYGDVVVHVFQSQTRDFYDLERLWADAPQMQIELQKDDTK